ncbi:hypothetical protein [Deinococcus sp. RL]|uniref:hypothetical protein n=1 Tax=Deinococcus sp. RL TaxID=1489678 RepID=UPI0013784DCE|nr:hypothetical protein [Deinococcus sp. RL]
MCRAPECRHFRLSEPGFTNRMLCSHPELVDLRYEAWEIPWTPALDFGCNRHEAKEARE